MTKYPTIKQTIKLIQDMGIRASYNPDVNEFRIMYHDNKASAYFTTSRHDALFTAQNMKENQK